MAQFSELQDRVLNYGFSDSKYRPSVQTWLNEAQAKVAQKSDMRQFFETGTLSLTAGDSSVDLPDDFLRLQGDGSVYDSTDTTDWTPLERIELRDFDDAPSSSGSPSAYVITGSLLYVYPTPSSAVTLSILYYRKPAEMVDAAEPPELVGFDDVLVDWALKRAYEREQDFEAAAYWEGTFNRDLADLQGQLQSDTMDGPTQVPGMWRQATYVGPSLP